METFSNYNNVARFVTSANENQLENASSFPQEIFDQSSMPFQHILGDFSKSNSPKDSSSGYPAEFMGDVKFQISSSTFSRRPTRVPDLKINSKNAVLARKNRIKKKEEHQALKATIEELKNKHKNCLREIEEHEKKQSKMSDHINYLESALQNQFVIAGVIKKLNIGNAPAIISQSSAVSSTTNGKVELNDYESLLELENFNPSKLIFLDFLDETEIFGAADLNNTGLVASNDLQSAVVSSTDDSPFPSFGFCVNIQDGQVDCCTFCAECAKNSGNFFRLNNFENS